jgi:predicted N-acetyltransferase YhbS
MVLGNPAYYQRFGFAPDRDITTPCSIRDEWADAWQSVRLLPKEQPLQGVLRAPEPWLDPDLWAP